MGTHVRSSRFKMGIQAKSPAKFKPDMHPDFGSGRVCEVTVQCVFLNPVKFCLPRIQAFTRRWTIGVGAWDDASNGLPAWLPSALSLAATE